MRGRIKFRSRAFTNPPEVHMAESKNRAVKFLRDYTVNNGTGVPPGPHFKAKAVYQLPNEQADFWVRTGHAALATEVEAADATQVAAVVQPSLDGLDEMKAKDLIGISEVEKIDLGIASKKSDIIAMIRAARAAKAAVPVPPAQPPSVQPPPIQPAAGSLPPPITK